MSSLESRFGYGFFNCRFVSARQGRYTQTVVVRFGETGKLSGILIAKTLREESIRGRNNLIGDFSPSAANTLAIT